MMEPLVSILVPAYNAQSSIGQTLRSAVEQTWKRKEIVVVDDGSADHTLAIARRWASAQVRVVSQNNQGAAAARNTALLLCQGDYIQWLDADDLLAADKVARQMEVAQSAGPRCLLSSAWGRFLCRPYKARFIPTALWSDLSPTEWLVRKMGLNLYMQTATWLVSRELTQAAGTWNTTLLGDDDGEYFARVLLASDGIRFVPDARVYYRVSGPARLSYVGLSERKLQAHWRSMQLHIEYLRRLEDSERVRMACARYLQASLCYFYPGHRDIVREAEAVASAFGYPLSAPHLPWKYSWLKELFGWELAKRVQQLGRRTRASLLRGWDRSMFLIDSSLSGHSRARRPE